MKNIILYLLLLFGIKSFAQNELSVIPKPSKATSQPGNFVLNQQTFIVANKGTEQLANYLQTNILKHQNLPLRQIEKSNSQTIVLLLNTKLKLSEEAYHLNISPQKIEIQATQTKGLFNGIVTLLQIIRQQRVINGRINIPCWIIEDQPLFAWRGFMLDESRHFFGKEKVKQILDWMAFYKLNKFHWHLTDQPGWRVEIKQYPKLTLIGGIGTFSDSLAKAQYYSQEEIKEIVQYAANRFIELIPEIDMPGHATAANKAYPEYSGGGSARYPAFTFNPGKESTYQYLTNILKEIDVLFPSQMIHIGADEVHFGNEHWNKDEAVQQLMKSKNFKNLTDVEGYFVQRMADSIKNLHNEVLAWDEVVSGDILSNDKTTVYWWRHDKPEVLKLALEKGFKVVLCPRLPLYFDFVQDASLRIGRKWGGKYVPLQHVYEFPTAEITDLPNANKLIRGMQANLWTENLAENQQLDFMLFPRIAALAEAAWTPTENKNFELFTKNLKTHFKLYNQEGIYFYNPFNPKNTPEWLTPAQRQKLPDSEGLTKQESKKN